MLRLFSAPLSLPPLAGDVELPMSSELYSSGSDDEKTIQELRGMLNASLTIREKVEKDRMVYDKYL